MQRNRPAPDGQDQMSSRRTRQRRTRYQPTRRARKRSRAPSTNATPIDRVLSLLDNVRPCGDQWSARCPAHADQNNSLSAAAADDGAVLLYCHAGCEFDEILDALDLKASALFAGSRRRYVRRKAARLSRARRPQA